MCGLVVPAGLGTPLGMSCQCRAAPECGAEMEAGGNWRGTACSPRHSGHRGRTLVLAGRTASSRGGFPECLESNVVELARSCHYAVRGLVYLSSRGEPQEPVLLRDIAAAIDAPEAFLSKIFQTLRSASLVRSHRGTVRGYALARDPSDISLYDVIVAAEGPATLHTSPAVVEHGGPPFAQVWQQVEEVVAERLKGVSIGDLAEMGAKKKLRRKASARET